MTLIVDHAFLMSRDPADAASAAWLWQSGGMGRPRRERATREARESLDKIRDEGGMFGASALAAAAERARRHFSGLDAPPGDKVEFWGRRIGRALAALFVAFLVFWLVQMSG